MGTKHKNQKGIFNKILFLLILPGCLFFLMVYPGFRDFWNSLAFDILFRLGISGVILYFTWLWKTKPSSPAKWTLTAAAVIVWFPLVLPSYRAFLWAATILEFVGTGVLLWEQIRLRKHTQPLLYVTAFLLLILIANAGSYTFVENPNGLHFGEVSLVFTLLSGALAAYLIFTGTLKLKDDRMSERIAFAVMGFLVGFFLIWPTMLNLNYLLDSRPPQVYEMPVQEKYVNTSGKNTTYHIYVSFQGEILDLEVSQSQYEGFAVGDRVPVALYEGAFGDPFYIVE